jgi:serine acetyltransferase
MKIFDDFKYNNNNTKGLFVIIFFRVSNFFSRNIITKIIGFPLRMLYKVVVQWILGCDISDNTKIGAGLSIFHGQGLVVHSNVVIGNYCILRQNTTIGLSKKDGQCPVIGNHVDIGANSVIIGDVSIGDYVIIGAGSVVTKHIPNNSIFVGNPAKDIKNRY